MSFKGWFDGELRPDGWFDAEIQPAGWFDTEVIYTAVSGGAVAGSMSATEAADTYSAAGKVIVEGVFSSTEASADGLSATGTVSWGASVTGSLYATESGIDSLAAFGTVAWEAITGTLAASESEDIFSGAGKIIVEGALAAIELADTLTANGVVSWGVPITGTLTASENGIDVFASSGNVTLTAVNGYLVAIEYGIDTAAIIGETGSPNYTSAPNGSGPQRVSTSTIRQSIIGTYRPQQSTTSRRINTGGRRY